MYQRPQHNPQPDTLNLIEKKVANNLKCIGTGDHFLISTPILQTLKSTDNKWDLMTLKSFCKATDTFNRTKQQTTEWKKISPTPHPTKG